MNSETGKWIILLGIVILLTGIILYFFHDKLNWIGRLPGDISIEKKNFRFYFPVVTMILLSVLVTIFVHIIKKYIQ